MKPAIAIAGLQEGKITPTETILCNHIYSRFLPWQFQCLGWHAGGEVTRIIRFVAITASDLPLFIFPKRLPRLFTKGTRRFLSLS